VIEKENETGLYLNIQVLPHTIMIMKTNRAELFRQKSLWT